MEVNILDELAAMTKDNSIGKVVVAGAWDIVVVNSLINSKPENILLLEPSAELYQSTCETYADQSCVKVSQSTLFDSTGKASYFLFNPNRFSSLVKPKKLNRIYKKQQADNLIDIDTLDLQTLCEQENIKLINGNILFLGTNCPAPKILNIEQVQALKLFDVVVINYPKHDLYDTEDEQDALFTLLTNHNFTLTQETGREALHTQFVFKQDHQSDKIKSLQVEILEAVARNTLLDTNVSEQKAQNEKLRAESALFKSQGEKLRTDIAQANEQTEKLSTEKNQLKGQVEKLNIDSSQHKAQTEKLNTENSQLKEQVEKLNADRAQLKTQAEKISTENSQLKGQVEKLNVDSSQHKAQTEKLNTENNQLKGQVEKLNTDSAALKEQTEKLSNENGQLKGQVEKLNADSAPLQAQTERLNTENGQFKGQIEKLNADRAPHTAQIEKLNIENAQLKGQNEKLNVDKANLTAQTEKLNAGNAQLKGQNETLSSDNTQLKNKIVKLEKQFETLNQQLAERQRYSDLALKLQTKSQVDLDDLREKYQIKHHNEEKLVELIQELRQKLQQASEFYFHLQKNHPELVELELPNDKPLVKAADKVGRVKSRDKS